MSYKWTDLHIYNPCFSLKIMLSQILIIKQYTKYFFKSLNNCDSLSQSISKIIVIKFDTHRS